MLKVEIISIYWNRNETAPKPEILFNLIMRSTVSIIGFTTSCRTAKIKCKAEEDKIMGMRKTGLALKVKRWT